MEKKTYLAKRLRAARKNAGMSLADAGASVGKSSKAISAYEAAINEPNMETMIGLCRAYGVEVSYFFPPVNSDASDDALAVLRDYFEASSDHGRELILELARMVSHEHRRF